MIHTQPMPKFASGTIHMKLSWLENGHQSCVAIISKTNL
jgi:hypothetical protein